MKTCTGLLACASAAALVLSFFFATACSAPKTRTGSLPNVTVRFGMLPYGDHTYAIIGAKQGWFRDVGITLQYRPVKVDDTIPFLLNGSLDVGSCSPGIIMAAYPASPGVLNFVFGDVFQG